jgi:hypothetical protein
MIPKLLVRNAVLEILRKSSEPATTRELATAAYYFTGDDRVGYGAVQNTLRALLEERLVEKVAPGTWRAVAL